MILLNLYIEQNLQKNSIKKFSEFVGVEETTETAVDLWTADREGAFS